MNQINKSATGSELIGYFANDDNNAYIQSTKGNSGIDNDGNNNIIYMNENLKEDVVPTEYGNQNSPFWLGLAHELAHRQDYIENGDKAKEIWLTKKNVTVRVTEKYATQVENQIRADFGMPLRTHYAPSGTSGVWEDSRILREKRESGFGVNLFTGKAYVPRLKVNPESYPTFKFSW